MTDPKRPPRPEQLPADRPDRPRPDHDLPEGPAPDQPMVDPDDPDRPDRPQPRPPVVPTPTPRREALRIFAAAYAETYVGPS